MEINYNNLELTAKTFSGLEDLLADELDELGAREIVVHNRAVSFRGDRRLMYEANYKLRTALRILMPISKFRVRDEKELYLKAKQTDWDEYIDPDMTLAVDSSIANSPFNHANYVALKVKDAIVDRIRARRGRRPDVSVENPDVRVNVHVSREDCTISLDSSGSSLHKRGWRSAQTEAPLSEVLAAAMVKLTGWHGEKVLVDPMCGSGTILIEAAMQAANIPAGSFRKFGFERWKDFDRVTWSKIVESARTGRRSIGVEILGSDISERALRIAEENIDNAGLKSAITLKARRFEHLNPPAPAGMIIINPPYGERLEKLDINAFYKSIGDKLKYGFSGYDAWIISSNPDAFKHIGLKHEKSLTLYNGQLECRFRKYGLYQGSRKDRYNKEE